MNMPMKYWVCPAVISLMPLVAFAQVIAPGQPVQRDLEQPPKTEKTVLKASDLIGMNVINKSNKELGSIEDLVIDPHSGKIDYAAMSVGGFAGVGDKLFAVPFDALDCSRKTGSTGTQSNKVVLDLQPETFQNAEGFDQNNWPDMANERWKNENDRQFQATRPGQESKENK